MKTGLLNICLYPEVKWTIIQHFIKNLDLRQNQTQLARSIKMPQNTVSRYISDLVKLRVLNEEHYGRSTVYSLNKTSLIVDRLLKEIVSSEERLLVDWISEQMRHLPQKVKNSVEEVIFFGSAARGDLKATSDIDLLVIISKENADLEFELNLTLVAAGADVGLKINLQIETSGNYSSPGLELRWARGSPCYTSTKTQWRRDHRLQRPRERLHQGPKTEKSCIIPIRSTHV